MPDLLHSALLVAAAAIVTFLLRLAPFAVFGGKRGMPDGLKKTAACLPPAIMGVLVIYCLKDALPAMNTDTWISLASAAVVVALHVLRRNTLLSIAAGTAVYMLLIRIPF